MVTKMGDVAVAESSTEMNEKDVQEEPVEDDLEDGEIEDDEEEQEEQPIEQVQENTEDGEDEVEDEEYSEKKKSRSKDKKSRHKDKERERRRVHRELESDEEKKRKLEEKLKALEMQMAAGDEVMGVYSSGASPPLMGRKRGYSSTGSDDYEDDEEDEEEEGSDYGSSESLDLRGERKKKRKRKDSNERKRRNKEGRNKEHRRQRRGEKSSECCQLFMQGKCPKSPDNCMFSHEFDPPPIMELCKFYLFERCAKREKCLYLHKGFPCKYFHTGTRCLDTAESCKFSHEPLTDEIRAILLKHLESAPKEILGDFPRMTRENAIDLVTRTEAKNKGWSEDDMRKHLPEELSIMVLGPPHLASEPMHDMRDEHNEGQRGEMKERRRKSRWQDNDGFMPQRMPLPPPQVHRPVGPRPGMMGMPPMRPPMFRGQMGMSRPPGSGPPLMGLAPGIPFPTTQMRPNFGGQQSEGMGQDMGANMGMPMGGPGVPGNNMGGNFSMNQNMGQNMTQNMNPNMTPLGQGLPHANASPAYSEKKDEEQMDKKNDHSSFKIEENWYSSDEDEDKKAKNDRSVDREPKPSGSRPVSSRDPRMKNRAPAPSENSESEKDKAILDLDLGSVLGDFELPSFQDMTSTKPPPKPIKEEEDEEDESGFRLPFKPYVSTTVAKEIDASIFSHSPLTYRLRPISVSPPDYSDVIAEQNISQSQVQQDPRLRKHQLKGASSSSAYSPTQQTFDLNNPPSYNPNMDLKGESKPKVNRRDPRRRD